MKNNNKLDIDFDELDNIKQALQELLDNLSTKTKNKLLDILKMFNIEEKNDLIKIQNNLEDLSEDDIDFFTRTEILNQISDLENIINS